MDEQDKHMLTCIHSKFVLKVELPRALSCCTPIEFVRLLPPDVFDVLHPSWQYRGHVIQYHHHPTKSFIWCSDTNNTDVAHIVQMQTNIESGYWLRTKPLRDFVLQRYKEMYSGS